MGLLRGDAGTRTPLGSPALTPCTCVAVCLCSVRGHWCPHANACTPGVVKPDTYKPVPDEPPNPTNVEETLQQIQANDRALEDVNLNNIKVKDRVAASPSCPQCASPGLGVSPWGWSLSQGIPGCWSSSRAIHVPLVTSHIPSVLLTSLG